ncbi:MAG: Undecaprenyl phosphate N,N'-diacetylbacillosamine 1-phosphate transferase [Firmicutes bacterium ADurb.Bin262]|nr:MAG: Undecaprenyl phosphate N,N'-diacetylbacillosamine 1-phosphate transferase [Firmicutes bacterium ADurb.Bin262]
MKRLFDIVFSLLGIVLAAPLMLAVALLVYLDDGGPVLYKQQRVGLNGQLFNIRKFRTMKNGTPNVPTAQLHEADACITRFGRFIRGFSLDEIVQLFNILEGTMSFVGPRPLIPAEKDIHQLRERYGVYAVRPGMTGLAQINGRDNLSVEQKAAYDKEYVENHTMALDIKILLKTVYNVLARKGVVEGSDSAGPGN